MQPFFTEFEAPLSADVGASLGDFNRLETVTSARKCTYNLLSHTGQSSSTLPLLNQKTVQSQAQ